MFSMKNGKALKNAKLYFKTKCTSETQIKIVNNYKCNCMSRYMRWTGIVQILQMTIYIRGSGELPGHQIWIWTQD